MPAVPNVQHEPHTAWSLIGVTTPLTLRSSSFGSGIPLVTAYLLGSFERDLWYPVYVFLNVYRSIFMNLFGLTLNVYSLLLLSYDNNYKFFALIVGCDAARRNKSLPLIGTLALRLLHREGISNVDSSNVGILLN